MPGVTVQKKENGYIVKVELPAPLDLSHLAALLRPVPSQLTIRTDPVSRSGDRCVVYHLNVPKSQCPWSARAFRLVVHRRLLKLLVDEFLDGLDGKLYSLWEVDSRPLYDPYHPSTYVLWELMRDGSQWAHNLLAHIEDGWAKDINRFTLRYDAIRDPHPEDRTLALQLKRQISSRAELISWIDVFFKDGLITAYRYARARGWIPLVRFRSC